MKKESNRGEKELHDATKKFRKEKTLSRKKQKKALHQIEKERIRYCLFNMSGLIFCGRVINGNIIHKLVYCFVESHIHKYSLFYHAIVGVDFNNP